MFFWIIWAQLCRPGEVCPKGFLEGTRGNFVLSAPGKQLTGLLVFSDEKHTCHSNFGACGPRFTTLNTRHDARQAQNRSPPGRFPQNLKTRVFQFSQKSAKVLPPLYMRAAPLQMPPELFAREPRNKTHHCPPVAPPGGPWCVLFCGSRAKSSGGF